jgi:hypothetical protein
LTLIEFNGHGVGDVETAMGTFKNFPIHWEFPLKKSKIQYNGDLPFFLEVRWNVCWFGDRFCRSVPSTKFDEN